MDTYIYISTKYICNGHINVNLESDACNKICCLYIPAGAYDVTVRDFMVRDVKYIWYGMTYKELKSILKSNKHLGSFPLVEAPVNMILLGSIPRQHLYKVGFL